MRPLDREVFALARRADQGWGIEGVWWGLAGLIAMRALTCDGRFLGSRWVLTGAPA